MPKAINNCEVKIGLSPSYKIQYMKILLVEDDCDVAKNVCEYLESSSHSVEIAADGTFLSTFGAKGNDPGQFNRPLGVSVVADGTVFVADYGNHRIQKWRPKE